jgi:hypothetical protein
MQKRRSPARIAVTKHTVLEENVMKTLVTFVTKFLALIVSPLSCFDRVLFKGYLPFRDARSLERFVDYVLKIKRKDFLKFAEQQSERVVAHAKNLAQADAAPYRFLKGKQRKDDLAHQIARERGLTEGLVCVLCCMECCPSFKLLYGDKRPRFVGDQRPQRVLYFYYLDADFGLIHLRLPTWFPFTLQVYVNGHEWLGRQLLQQRQGFVQQDNAFVQFDDVAAAQKQADRFARLAWRRILNRWARRVNPLLREPWLRQASYYWVIDQAEYSTDVLFRSRQSLAGLYPRLLDHAAVHFSAQDILTFLGRRLHGRFDGEVLTDCKKDRWPGARIKHRMKNNWLKMYDKFGQILRVETVINNPREFKVRRWRVREGQRRLVWCPMNKGVCNLYRYQEVALAANHRYLEALAVVDNPAPTYREVAELTEARTVQGRSSAGFNPARAQDIGLFRAVLDGNHLVRGFRNADIRRTLQGAPKHAEVKRRYSTAVSRLLKRLHVRGLIAKVPRTRRWQVTTKGRRLLGAAVQLYHHGIPKAAAQTGA